MLKINVGDTAPEFCLPDKDGNEVCLKDLKGKWVVLYFYPKDNTKGCTIEAIEFTTSLPEFEKMGATVIGISPDSTSSHQKFTEKHELKVRLLSDVDKNILNQYGSWGEKSMYGKTYFGVIRSTVLIDPEGIIAETWFKVRVKDHVLKVKETLKELQN